MGHEVKRRSAAWSMVLLLLSSQALAKDMILFVDLNNNPDEVNAARRAAEPKMDFRVIPKSKEEISNYKEPPALRVARIRYEELLTKLNALKGGPDPEDVAGQLVKAEEAMAEARENFHDSGESTIANLLGAAIGESEAKKQKIPAVIFSGHHTNGYFGANGEIDTEQMKSMIADHPTTRDSVTTVIGAGCYSGTPGRVAAMKDVFPNLMVHAGYGGRAPKGDSKEAGAYIADILNFDRQLANLKSKNSDAGKKEVKSILANMKSLKEIDYSIYQTGKCGDLFSSSDHGTLTLEELKKVCKADLDYLSQHLPEYRKFESGEIPLPKETSGTPLREFYNILKDAEHCIDDLRQETDYPHEWENALNLNPDVVLRVLFSRNVAKNALGFYKVQFDTLRARVARAIDLTKRDGEQPQSADDYVITAEDIESPEFRAILLRKDDKLRALLRIKPGAGVSINKPGRKLNGRDDPKTIPFREALKAQVNLMERSTENFVPSLWVESNGSIAKPRTLAFGEDYMKGLKPKTLPNPEPEARRSLWNREGN